MAYDGAGVYTLPVGSTATPGTTVLASTHNTPLTDIQTALNLPVLRDGRAPMTGNQPMGGFKHTNLGAGTATTDSVNFGQVGDVMGDVVSTGSAGVYAVTISQTFAALAGTELQFAFRANHTNTIAAPTINVNGLGAVTIVRPAGGQVGIGNIVAGYIYRLFYNGTNFVVTNLLPGAWQKLADTGFGAGSTSLTITGLAGATRIIVKFNELTVVNSGESILFQPGDSGGSFYTTFSAARTRLIGTVLSGSNDPNINIVASHNTAAANIRYHGELNISGWTPSPGEDMIANLSCLYDSGATGALSAIFRGEPLLTLDRLRISATAGNITGGNVLVYGVFV